MKRIISIVAFLFLSVSLCFADSIYLKSGRVVEGTIVERTAEQIKINANGMSLTYYADEVDRIEGSSQPSQEDGASTPATITSSEQETSDLAGQGPVGDFSLDKKELILKYMEATGAKGNMRRTFAEIISAASEDKKEELKRVLDLDDVMNELVPVYDQYFTAQDLQELIAFYESPLGQKVLKTAPLILKDSMDKSINYFKGKLE
jgi:hypothetical protein